MEAQFSSVYDIAVLDINKDGHMDLIAGGNLYAVKPEIGRYDASNGIVMLGDGKGHFTALSGKKSGFECEGEIRQILPLTIGNKQKLMAVRNNDKIKIFEYNIK